MGKHSLAAVRLTSITTFNCCQRLLPPPKAGSLGGTFCRYWW